jgi:hypothetical protein
MLKRFKVAYVKEKYSKERKASPKASVTKLFVIFESSHPSKETHITDTEEHRCSHC